MLKRTVLWWNILVLNVCCMFVTMNLNIAIVSMVKGRGGGNSTARSFELVQPNHAVCPNTSLFLRDLIPNKEVSSPSKTDESGLDWTDVDENTALSGFYYLSYLAIMPGGVLAHKYGSKVVVGYSVLISAVMSSLIPWLAKYGAVAVACVRAFQGVLSLIAMPGGVYTMLASWSPPDERGWFGTTIEVGAVVGMTFGSLLFGYIAQYLHWTYVFHLTSVCGIVWSVFWFTCIFDSPAQHPSITQKEREYIEKSLEEGVSNTKTSIPWKGIMTSVPLVVCIVSCCAGTWSWVLLNTYSPVYLNTFYGLNSNEIGIITCATNLMGSLLTLVAGHYSDVAVKKEAFSVDAIRKFCTFIGNAVSAVPFLAMAFIRCDLTLILACILINCGLRSIDMFGAGIAIMDMSPKFCGVLQGYSGTVQSLTTFVITAIFNYLTRIFIEDVVTLWKVVFLGTTVFSVVATASFVIYGTSDVQNWNFVGGRKTEEELEPLPTEAK